MTLKKKTQHKARKDGALKKIEKNVGIFLNFESTCKDGCGTWTMPLGDKKMKKTCFGISFKKMSF